MGVHTVTFAYREDGTKLDKIEVRAVDASTPTPVPPTPTPTADPDGVVAAINSGGGAAVDYDADHSYSGGNTYTSGSTIDTSAVTNPAP